MSRLDRSASKWSLVALSAALAAAAVGCGSSKGGGTGGAGGAGGAPAGGAVTGELDTHCAGIAPIVVSQASCDATPPTDVVEEPTVHYNAAADDDDCKYHVSFTTTPVRLNENVTFKVTASALGGAQGSVTGAAISIEGVIGVLGVLPNNGTKTVESPPGVYTISPVKFDQSGRWTITYHLFETCNDLVDSPHGHASFFIDVP